LKGKKFKIRVKLFRRDPERNDMESAALQISLKCSSKYPKIVEVEYIVGSISRKVKDGFDGDTLDLSYKEVMKELKEGSLTVTAREIPPTSTSRKIFETMSNPDFAIICDGVRIKCHQIFLTNSSKVFAEIIEADQKDTNETEEKEVNKCAVDIPCSASVGENMLRFIYTGELDPKALENDAEVFLKLGNLYEMEALKDLAERKMMDNLSTDNMVKFFLVGDQYKAEGLRMKAKDLIKCNIKMLKKKEGWKDQFGSNKDILIEILEYCV